MGGMESGRHNPDPNAAAAHRPGLYRELRERNERRARVARLVEARREYSRKVERVLQFQRARRSTQRG